MLTGLSRGKHERSLAVTSRISSALGRPTQQRGRAKPMAAACGHASAEAWVSRRSLCALSIEIACAPQPWQTLIARLTPR